jgi:AcrR family transcriptional regulator
MALRDWVVNLKLLLTSVRGRRGEDQPRLTPKGARTRARRVEEAAALIHERGVAATTLEDVKVAAEVSGSQLYH